MKKIKTSLAFIPFIAGGIGCFYVTLWLGLAYLLVMALIGTVIVICKASAGREEIIIKIESLLNEPHSKENSELIKKLLSEILPSELPDKLYWRYKNAEDKAAKLYAAFANEKDEFKQ